MTTATDTDRIERSILIEASREKVWRALSDAETFGTWFGVDLKGQAFRPGMRTKGQITSRGYEHIVFDIVVERVEPQSLLSYRWHPYPIDSKVDYEAEEPTLVVFTLKDAPGNGTHVTVVETGFDRIPPERRLEAFRMNGQGWTGQMAKLQRYVSA